MSNLSEDWAMYYAPVASPAEKLVLVALAHRTSDDGCNGFKSKKTLAQAAMCDPKTAQRALSDMKKRGLIASGDQSAAAYIDGRYRPHVYDLQIPYSWYSAAQMAQVNLDRATRGLKPLAPADRPDLGPPPPRAPRSDKGKPAPQRRPKSLGPRPEEKTNPDQDSEGRGDSQSPLPEEPRGDSQSQSGGIEKDARGDSESPNSLGSNSFKRDSENASPPAVGGLQHRRESGSAAVPAGANDESWPQEERTAAAPHPAEVVFALLPADLARRISDGAKGRVLATIQRALSSRTPGELGERIERRWAWWTSKGERVNDAVAAAITLVEARHCANARCEDGIDLESGDTCPVCSGRGPRRAGTAPAPAAYAVPAPRQTPPTGAPTPTAAPYAEVQEKHTRLTLVPDLPEQDAPKPSRTSGSGADASIADLRASLGTPKPSARQKRLQGALGITCRQCHAEPGSLCRGADNEELILVNTHSVRVADFMNPPAQTEETSEQAAPAPTTGATG
ncbi:hypothetical protein [Streptosporangium sp. NPDC002524]|uniref:zinc finger domain-containing protein n=1 Tax=Streptosporangium sp. NPDC002524 TaxID=3154537 RepID=UPI0033333E71